MSYYTVFQLEKEPFSTSPDPEFLFQSAAHKSVLNRLEIAIRLKRGLSIVLGDVGIGKTTLSRALFQTFAEDQDFIFHMILDPDFKSEYQFLAHLTKLFGVTPFFRSTIDLRDAIEKYLFKKNVDENKTVVVLIDEGQKLSLAYLEILRTLLNYETNDQKMLQLVIMAQMELLPRIIKIKNFMDRVSFKYIINPLDEFETTQLIQFRLQQAGYRNEKSLFTPEAVRKIFESSQGYPRRIAMICHDALEQLIIKDREVVTADLIEELLAKQIGWQ